MQYTTKTSNFRYENKKVHLQVALKDGKDNIGSTILKKKSFYDLGTLRYIQKLKIKGDYIDIGANIGNHSVFFSKFCLATSILSCECNPSILSILEHNMNLNVEIPYNICPYAILDKSKQVFFKDFKGHNSCN